MSTTQLAKTHRLRMYKQICFAAQQKAHTLVEAYTFDQVAEKAELRGLKADSPKLLRTALKNVITKELYILEVTRMELWPKKDLEKLGRGLELTKAQMQNVGDEIHLAWLIALMLIRDQHPYEFTSERKIRLKPKSTVSVSKKSNNTTNTSKS